MIRRAFIESRPMRSVVCEVQMTILVRPPIPNWIIISFCREAAVHSQLRQLVLCDSCFLHQPQNRCSLSVWFPLCSTSSTMPTLCWDSLKQERVFFACLVLSGCTFNFLLQEKVHLISRECVDASLQVSDQFHKKKYSIKTIFQPWSHPISSPYHPRVAILLLGWSHVRAIASIIWLRAALALALNHPLFLQKQRDFIQRVTNWETKIGFGKANRSTAIEPTENSALIFDIL